MKQSELKHWRWDAKSRSWTGRCAGLSGLSIDVDLGDTIVVIGGQQHRQYWAKPEYVSEFARIARHYHDTGTLEPEREAPTYTQIRVWLSQNWVQVANSNGSPSDWIWRPKACTGVNHAQCVDSRHDPSRIVAAIATIIGRDADVLRAEIAAL